MDKASSKVMLLSPILRIDNTQETKETPGLFEALGEIRDTLVEFDCEALRPRLIHMARVGYVGYCASKETLRHLEALHDKSGLTPPPVVKFAEKSLHRRSNQHTSKLARADIVCIDSLRLSSFVSERGNFKEAVANALELLNLYGRRIVLHTILADENESSMPVNVAEHWKSAGLKREPPLYKNLEFLTAEDYRAVAKDKGLVMEGPFKGEVYIYEGVTLTTSYLAFTETKE